ncbi:NUDIX domain-containing protein [Paenibacillus sp. GCM10027626]|uniref:NUDIX domain-containing protein n=1 Tax=Paenibacillus sp. GCM10027626 TaxID=3273411 RepID=UPI003626D495
MNIKFRHIARALIIDNDQILIARMKGAHSFLPGGGIELGEGAQTALIREIKEELGVSSCDIIRFLGVIEYGREEENDYYHEITHLFEIRSKELTSNAIPLSLESHLEFYWLEPTADNLKNNNVLPELLHKMIPQLFSENKPLWVSNM